MEDVTNECIRELSISETLVETVHLVSPTHINPLGILHGGVGLRWMITTASMAAMRVARGPAFIAHLDHVFFINPVHLGHNAVITSWVEYIGRSSIELTTLMEEENPATGDRVLTTAAHMTYVAVDESIKPRRVPTCLTPKGPLERELYERAKQRREQRGPRLNPEDLNLPRSIHPEAQLTSYKLVNPEDTLALNAMHGGRLMYLMDELAGITAIKYSKGIMVTAGIDATDFVSPIWVGDILEIHTAITYVGNTSVEVTVKAITGSPSGDVKRHATTSYFTLVHLGVDGKPRPVPPFKPREPWQRELYEKARERKRQRNELLKFFKQEIKYIKPPKTK